jgi:hypothetical protein
MNTTTTYFIKLILLAVFYNQFCFVNDCFSASQGTLGKQSSASIEISVHINQTLNTISPNELLLNQSKGLITNNSKPLCVANQGFSEGAIVPYELKIDELTTPNQHTSSSYNVFLEDKSSFEKLALVKGMSIATQSAIEMNKSVFEECKKSGLALSIEMNHENHFSNAYEAFPGLLILMVSPI